MNPHQKNLQDYQFYRTFLNQTHVYASVQNATFWSGCTENIIKKAKTRQLNRNYKHLPKCFWKKEKGIILQKKQHGQTDSTNRSEAKSTAERR